MKAWRQAHKEERKAQMNAWEQDSQYIGDCVNLYAKLNGDVE